MLLPLFFYIGTSASIDTYIILTPYNGDADLFVGKDAILVTWSKIIIDGLVKVEVGGEDVLIGLISKTDPNRCIPTVAKPCRYCIKVKTMKVTACCFPLQVEQTQLKGP